jgi:hypothetical protein|tara:strand:+ start:504 stop:665 length:162 start_codon:yes stop_codon:yes gene_type:complete
MKCFICNGDVLWGNDFDAEDVYDNDEYLFVSNYSCKNCNASYEVCHGKKENEQ